MSEHGIATLRKSSGRTTARGLITVAMRSRFSMKHKTHDRTGGEDGLQAMLADHDFSWGFSRRRWADSQRSTHRRADGVRSVVMFRRFVAVRTKDRKQDSGVNGSFPASNVRKARQEERRTKCLCKSMAEAARPTPCRVRPKRAAAYASGRAGLRRQCREAGRCRMPNRPIPRRAANRSARPSWPRGRSAGHQPKAHWRKRREPAAGGTERRSVAAVAGSRPGRSKSEDVRKGTSRFVWSL